MTRRVAERALWGAAAVVAFAGALSGRAETDSPVPGRQATHAISGSGSPDPARIARAVDSLVARDLFRPTRRPSPIAFATAVEGAAPPPPRPPKPALALVGIVGGSRRTALVEGLPGREGASLVAQGDTVGGLRIRTITRDTVIIAGMDTIWRLAVRQAW